MKSILNEIQITPVKPQKGLVAFASCSYADLALNGIAIYVRPNGINYRLVYPTKTLLNGKVINLFYPTNKTIGDLIQNAVLKEYRVLISKL